MLCIGLEGTAHTLGIGVIDSDGKIYANIRDEYVPESGGIHPREAAQHHADVFSSKIQKLLEVLEKQALTLNNMDLIAFSRGPGLGPCLRVTATAARVLSHLLLNIPLVGVNHCAAHIELGRLVTGFKDPLVVYVSGGNTIISAYEAGSYRVFGETLDIALGNMLDTFARAARLPHPGGPKIEKLAKNSTGTFVSLPYSVKGMDLSFSGLLTAAVNKLKEDVPLEDLCFSLQEVSFAMLTEVTERALAHTEKSEVLLTGGVAANKRLQEMLQIISQEHDATFHAISPGLAGDNGVMIAWMGLIQFMQGDILDMKNSKILPKWSLSAFEFTRT
ncbi:MAG: bifunctional N(6)-L-threonylcarbamoyladenine synthase/serine/threonine protein kinase [Promethearchaeota archaeon]